MGPSWGRLGPVLGRSWGGLGPSWGRLGAVLGPFWGYLGLSQAILNENVDLLKSIQKQMFFNHFGPFTGAQVGPRWAKLGPKRGQDHILKRLGSSSREDVEKMLCRSRFKVVLRRFKSVLAR